MIFKISGCSQMWCPDCHTAFDWRSGAIETGMVHNPHFYEFQRRTGNTGRVAGDIPCGGLPSHDELRRYMGIPEYNGPRYMYRHQHIPDRYKYIAECHRMVSHVENVELRYHYVATPPVDNSDLRVKYLMNELEEVSFKTKIQRREKAYAKTRAIRDIMNMFVNAASDMLRQMVLNRDDERDETLLHELVVYCNESFANLAKQYTHKPKQFVWMEGTKQLQFV